MKLTDWIRAKWQDHGPEWVAQNHHIAERECGRPITYDSYTRTMRRVREEIERSGKATELGRSLDSSDVDTEGKSALYHDVDDLRWKPRRMRVNTWGSPTNPNKQVRIEYDTRNEPTPADFAEQFDRLISSIKPPKHKNAKITAKTGIWAEIAIVDHHFGRMSWENPAAAEEMFLDAVRSLMAPYRRGEFARILFPLGQDYLNWDNWQQTTTAGTPMEPGGKQSDVIGIAIRTLVRAIDYVSQFGPVDAVIVPGNHDWLLSHMLGRVLSAWYRGSDVVSIDDALESWKFRSNGQWLVALTHGKDPETKRAIGPDQLASALPIKAPRMWADSTYREVQTGHLHHKSKTEVKWVQDENGVIVRRIASLAPRDEYEHANLLHGMREAELFLFDDRGPFESRSFRP